MKPTLVRRIRKHLAAERAQKLKLRNATNYARMRRAWTNSNRKLAMAKMEAQKRPTAPLPPMVEAWMICQKYGIPWF